MDPQQNWPALQKDDEGLLDELNQILSSRVAGNPYGADGAFAAGIAHLPSGLRAMAATHWLDLSLTLDSITWHFGNFGEPGLARETEAGLRELGLDELAECFAEAKALMTPLLDGRTDEEDGPSEILDRAGLGERGREIDHRAWNLGDAGPGESAIYKAWVQYTRRYPERVFGPAPAGSGDTAV